MINSSPMPKGRKTRGEKNARSLKKEWGGSQGRGNIPVWEDMELEPSTPDPAMKEELDFIHKMPDRYDEAKQEFISSATRHQDLRSIQIPIVAKIPRDQRLSFADENEGVNTRQANYDPCVDRCKAMDIATKQAAQREDAAREMLTSRRMPPPRSPMLGSAPKSPIHPLLGFGTSTPRIDSMRIPSFSPQTSRTHKRGQTPEPSPMQTHRDTSRGPGLHRDTSRGPVPSPMQSHRGVLPQRPRGPPPSQQQPPQSPLNTSRQPPQPPQSPRNTSRQPPPSPQAVARQYSKPPGPPRCASNAALSSQMGRASSASRVGPSRRCNSYLQSGESFSQSNQSGAWTYRGSQDQVSSARNRTVSPSPISRNNSYVPPPQINTYGAAPGSPYGPPPPSSPMMNVGSQFNLSSDAQYPNSIEKIRDAGLAMCNRLFQPPPRSMSFEPPDPQPPSNFFNAHSAVAAPPPTRMFSGDGQPGNGASFMALPFPMPPFAGFDNPFAASFVPPPINMSSDPTGSPMSSHRINMSSDPTGSPMSSHRGGTNHLPFF